MSDRRAGVLATESLDEQELPRTRPGWDQQFSADARHKPSENERESAPESMGIMAGSGLLCPL